MYFNSRKPQKRILNICAFIKTNYLNSHSKCTTNTTKCCYIISNTQILVALNARELMKNYPNYFKMAYAHT